MTLIKLPATAEWQLNEAEEERGEMEKKLLYILNFVS